MNTLQVTKQQRIISIREFIKELSAITSRPKEKMYTLVKNGRKVGTYIPDQYEDEILTERYFSPEPHEEKLYKSLFDTYNEIAFKGGPKDLSKQIDKVVYGIEEGK